MMVNIGSIHFLQQLSCTEKYQSWTSDICWGLAL